jgi:hypothetical protein
MYYDQLAAQDKFRYMHERTDYRNYLQRVKKTKNGNTEKQQQQVDYCSSTWTPNTPLQQSQIPVFSSLQQREELFLPPHDVGPHSISSALEIGIDDPTRPYSLQEIARLADQLDSQDIDFLINVLI